MKKTLLLVFIHGFKGSDHTFHNFPTDVQALLAHTLPKIDVVTVQYPRFETKGELKGTVAKFKEWLQNKVIDLEVANRTPSPTVDPSVHVVLCGHSMGGIVAAETLLSIAHEQVLPPETQHANDTTNHTTRPASSQRKAPTNLVAHEDDARPSSAPPVDHANVFFPHVTALIAFDTPYLGISPGVLAHGAEEHLNQASSAYKAFDSASSFFGWNSPRSTTPQPIPDAANRALPAADGTNTSSGGWNKWGKYAAIGGAAAAIAGAAGAAYLNRDQISQGFAWAGSHLEFVNTLARGAELQKRVENVVQLSQTHSVGFADFYTALGEKVTSQTKYAGSVLGADRTFCVVPKSSKHVSHPESPTGTKRDAPSSHPPENASRPSKSQKPPTSPANYTTESLEQEMDHGDQVQQYAQDTTKSKGHWVKCINTAVTDEIAAHTSMFSPKKNPGYHVMLPKARDEIVRWIEKDWYESSLAETRGHYQDLHHDEEEDVVAGAERDGMGEAV